MIPRILVPAELHAVAAQHHLPPARTSTSLDSRLLIPADLPVAPLDRSSTIPAHVPLSVLGERTVVPRDISAAALAAADSAAPAVIETKLDARIAVPADARPAAFRTAPPALLAAVRDVVEPDLFTTGVANLLISPEETRQPIASWIPAWVAPVGTALVHLLLVAFVLLMPRLFPPRMPTEAEIEMAARSLGMIYLPPSVREVPPAAPPPGERPSDKLRIDPRILREILRPDREPSPLPGPPAPPAVNPAPELPSRPRPRLSEDAAPGDSSGQPSRADASREPPRLESPAAPEKPSSSGLILPRMSPGRALEDSARESLRGGGSGLRGSFSDRIPGGGGGPPMGGGGGEGYLGGNLEMLTPTEGVDFSTYLARLLASIKRNWYAVIPESARLGERGRVILQFRVLRDGSVPAMDPRLLVTSTKEHLDRAAMSSIRASSPFEPLPPAFSGPFIELRITYLYNLPLDYR